MKTMFNDGTVISRLTLSDPGQELLQWAKENIREDPDTRCQMLEELRELIYSRGECTPVRTDDAFLLRFIRGRKFSLEAAYRLYANYCDFQEENPSYYKGGWLSLLRRIGEHDIINVPPYREQTGKRMLLYRLGNWDPEYFTIDEVFKATLVILELAIMEPQAQILGGVCIIDFANLSMQQVWHMNPGIAHKVIQIMVTSFPMKVEALHIVNQSWMFDMIFNLFKPFLEDRMKERIFIHGDDMDSLHKHVDPKWLPQQYGGVHPHDNYEDWIEGFRKDEHIVKEMESLGYKEEGDENKNDEQ